MVYKSASTDRTSARSKPPLAAFNRDPRKGTPQISISFREKLRRAAGTKGDNGENTTAFTSRRLVHRWTERKISNLDIYSARPRLRPKDVSIRDLSLSLSRSSFKRGRKGRKIRFQIRFSGTFARGQIPSRDWSRDWQGVAHHQRPFYVNVFRASSSAEQKPRWWPRQRSWRITCLTV